MFKKLFNSGSASNGNITNFITSLKREITLWKAIVIMLILLIILMVTNKPFEEAITTHQIKDISTDVIAKVAIEGVIMPNVLQEKLFEEINKSSHIKGLLVVIDSPGGDPNHSEFLYLKLKEIRNKIPVIVAIKGLGASGGYMVALGGEKIIAMKTSLVGSIGVISNANFDLSELLNKYNIGVDVYRTTEYKSSSIWLKTTENQREYMKDLIMQIALPFYNMVQEERKLTETEMKLVANAKVFAGEKALQLKLIDAIGTQEYALEILKESVKQKFNKAFEVQEIKEEPKKKKDFFESLFGGVNAIKAFFESFIAFEKRPILAKI